MPTHIRAPTREELKTAQDAEQLETNLQVEQSEHAKRVLQEPVSSLIPPTAEQKRFTLQDMIALKGSPVPERVEPEEPSLASKVSAALPKDTQLGVTTLLEERPELRESKVTPGQKALTRAIGEAGAGAAAAARFGPAGTAVGLASSTVRALPPLGRALAIAYPRTARAVLTAPVLGGGELMGSLISETFDPSERPFNRAVKTGLLGASVDIFIPHFARAFERLRSTGTKLNRGAREVVERLLNEGQPVSPGFFTPNFIIQVMDNVASGSMIGGGRMARAQSGGARILESDADRFLDNVMKFAEDSVEVEDMAKELFGESAEAFRLVGKKKYGIMDEISRGGVRVSINSMEKELKVVLREVGGADATSKLTKELARLRKIGEIDSLGFMSFETAADWRSKLLSIARGGDELFGGQAQGLGKRLSKIMDAEMEKSFSETVSSGKILQVDATRFRDAWRDANAFWKEGPKIFNSSLIKSLSKDQPRSIVAAIKNSTRNIRSVKKILLEGVEGADTIITAEGRTGKEVWGEIQGEILNKMGRDSITNVGDQPVLTGGKMLNQLFRKEEQMVELLGRPAYNNAVKIFRQLALAQGSGVRKGLPGRVFITFKQAGAISEVGGMVIGTTTDKKGTAIAFLLGPAAMGTVLTSKTFTRLVLLGLDPKTPPLVASRAIEQMFVMAFREGATLQPVEEPEKTTTDRRALPAFIRGPSRPPPPPRAP